VVEEHLDSALEQLLEISARSCNGSSLSRERDPPGKPGGSLHCPAQEGEVFIKKRTKKIMSEVVPLLQELYPDHTNEERASILTLFAAAHPSQPIADLDRSHIDMLIQTLRYWAAGRKFVDWFKGDAAANWSDSPASPAWPGIEDVCEGCQDFKAAMVEILAGIKVKTDQEGHVLSPITVEGHDQFGQSLSEGFRDWIVRGGPRPEGI
jgi:hypothetical protein